MPYVVAREHLFWWPVKVRKPDPDEAGTYAESDFEMRFRALGRDRVREIEASAREALTGAQAPDVVGNTLREVCVGWNGDVRDEEGNEVEFSADLLAQAMRDPWFTNGAWAAYLEAISKDPAQGN